MITQEMTLLLKFYNEGLKKYKKGIFKEALGEFEKALEITYDYYINKLL